MVAAGPPGRNCVIVHFPQDTALLLDRTGKGKATNKFIFLVAALHLLAERYSGSSQQLIATTPLRQGAAAGPVDAADSLFFFRMDAHAAASIRDLLKMVHNQLVEGKDRADFDFNAFRESFVLNGLGAPEALLRLGLSYSAVNEVNALLAETELLFNVVEAGPDRCRVELHYDESVYAPSLVRRMAAQYVHLAGQVCADLGAAPGKLGIVTPGDQQLLASFNNRTLRDDTGKTVIDMFRDQVSRVPDNTALVTAEQSFTYRELDRRSDLLAAYIIQIVGVQPDEIIGVLLDYSEWRMIGLLAVLKAGVAYLPLRPDFPVGRINFMLEDCSCRAVVASSCYQALTASLQVAHRIIVPEHVDSFSGQLAPPAIAPHHLFVVLYTSGSTGKPKGVLLEHGSLADRLRGEIMLYGLTENTVTIQTSNYAFDSSLLDFFLPVVLGGRLVMPREEEIVDFKKLAARIEAGNVTDIQVNPNFLRSFLEEIIRSGVTFNNSLQRIWSGGESLNKTLVELVHAHLGNTRISNHYGPTEGTIDALVEQDIREFSANVIGRPIYNMQVYILDKHCNLQPPGVPGELCVSGKGLARGYLNLEALTREKFIAHPFLPGERLYRTGDLARWLEDGRVEYLGRIDDQIKIRGYRVEMGEVEHALLGHGSIREALVVAKADSDGIKFLVAYVIGAEALDVTALRLFLREKLPEFMIPSFFVQLDKFPLTSVGKIDKKALPEVEAQPRENLLHYAGPQNATEAALQAIWAGLLTKHPIGINDNFFEIGGHSLKVTQVMSRVFRELQVQVGFRDVYNYPTIAQLARFIMQSRHTAYQSIPAVAQRASYPASSAQMRMWLLQGLGGQRTAYNITDAFEIEGSVRVEALGQAVWGLVKRHESLRTTFCLEGEQLTQRIAESQSPDTCLRYHDLTSEANQEHVLRAFVAAEAATVFDLVRGPLLRVNLFCLGEERYVFTMSVHHIVIDEWSMQVLMEELALLYNAYSQEQDVSLPALRIQYKDYAEWQRSLPATVLAAQEAYWLDVFKGAVPKLNLPTDQARSARPGAEARYRFEISREETERLRAICRSEEATLYTVLLAVLNVLLHKLSGQEDIVVGTVVSGRNHADLEPLVGLFVNTLALRNSPTPQLPFTGFLRNVKERTLMAFENQDYPFEELVGKICTEREPGRNPLFDVFFELQVEPVEQQLIHLQLKPYQAPYRAEAKFELALSVTEKPDHVSLLWSYDESRFRAGTVTALSQYFLNLVRAFGNAPQALLGQVSLLSDHDESILKRKLKEAKGVSHIDSSPAASPALPAVSFNF
jgi:amino acid adenylation domain-containing protein